MPTSSAYPPLNVQVHTPRLSLRGATDELLEQLVPTVRKGVVTEPPWPFDDPASLYEDSPEREWRRLRGIWRGRGQVSESQWRLYFVVVVGGEPVGIQDLIGTDFATFGTVTTFSWLSPDLRGRGLGKELRHRTGRRSRMPARPRNRACAFRGLIARSCGGTTSRWSRVARRVEADTPLSTHC
ncbi:hypothetical protein [Amycolatopsis coloradensis]|uniref:hypothetical protein n=1 Tax=Amycolatopsis coloradensis TaxID=76021 RepID=UPI0030F3A707